MIIPCYNVEKYIDRCMKSIVGQTIGIENLQVIVVNDASTDHTLKRLYDWEQKYPKNIMLVDCEENHKQGAARNIGMQYAVGRYISFVDSDDVLDSSMLLKMYMKICQYNCDVVECQYKEFEDEEEDVLIPDRKGEDYYIKFDTVYKRKAFILDSLKVAPWGRLYRTDFLRKNNLLFMEDVYYEDSHFSGLAMLMLDSYYAIGETLYYYYLNPGGTIKSTAGIEKVKWEIDVERQLIKDIIERKILPESLEPYREELMYYVTAKGCLDGLIIMARAGKMRDDLVLYLIENLIGLFPDCLESYWLNRIQLPFWEEAREIIRVYLKKRTDTGDENGTQT